MLLKSVRLRVGHGFELGSGMYNKLSFERTIVGR